MLDPRFLAVKGISEGKRRKVPWPSFFPSLLARLFEKMDTILLSTRADEGGVGRIFFEPLLLRLLKSKIRYIMGARGVEDKIEFWTPRGTRSEEDCSCTANIEISGRCETAGWPQAALRAKLLHLRSSAGRKLPSANLRTSKLAGTRFQRGLALPASRPRETANKIIEIRETENRRIAYR